MKLFSLPFLFLLLSFTGFTQDPPAHDYTGHYQVDFYPSRKIDVYKQGDQLIFEIVGQGKTVLIPLTAGSFTVKGLPHSTVEFLADNLGGPVKMKWLHQPFKSVWKRMQDAEKIKAPADSAALFIRFAGKYSQKGNGYLVTQITAETDHLTSQIPGETKLSIFPTEKNKFVFRNGDFTDQYEFLTDKEGNATGISTSETGPIICTKISSIVTAGKNSKHSFTDRGIFSETDSLQGMLSPMRSCFNVLFYNLAVKVDPDTKSIQGNNIIRFLAENDFTEIQIDLFASMTIEKILYKNTTLSFTRKYDAVFIRFPEQIKKGTEEEIQIFYSGTPRIPDMSKLFGGFFWTQDKNGKPWIEVVSQGSGASLWWPCKDHLSDKPDSMRISVTVPAGLTAIANGTFIGKTELPDNQVRFQWAVHYPMNTYSAVLYIGDYAKDSADCLDSVSHFPVNFYYLSYHPGIALPYFKHVKPLLAFYQDKFGPYPFPKDGFAIVESPYGMEHQSAVSIGAYSNPSNEKPLDSIELIRVLYHESSHEWWGNSVTCSDYADFWIHESFASYAEVIAYAHFSGDAAAEKYMKQWLPENKEPIIGFYGVNDFHEGDMYPKGARMIATLRNTMNNDSLFFSILKGIQRNLKFQSIQTADIIQYFNAASGTDYTYVFDQYLRHASIPKLIISMTSSGKDVDLRFRWEADVKDFRLPVKMSVGSKETLFIYPTAEWKSIHLENCKPKEIKMDNLYSYFELKTE